jgi:hypothetical protein
MQGWFMDGVNSKTRDYSLFWLLALALGSVLIRVPVLLEPWGGDQGGFGYVGAQILQGKVPYKDIYDLTGYGVFFTFALFFRLFGLSMAAPHIGHLLISVATVLVVYAVANRAWGRPAAWIAAIICSLFSNGLAFSGFGYENKSAWGTYWYLSQREVFMAPLMAGAVFLMMISPKRRGWSDCIRLFGIGVLIGSAAVYKFTAALFLVALIGFLGIDDLWDGGFFSAASLQQKAGLAKRALGRCVIVLAGFASIQLPFLYYFWAHGALRDMYQALFIHVAAYAKLSRGLRIETFFSGHYSVLKENLILWLFTAASCCRVIFKNRTRNDLLIVVWAVASLAMVWGQGKFFGYHFIILVPPFAILTSYGLMNFFEWSSGLSGFLKNNLRDIRKCFIATAVAVSLLSFGILNYDYYRWHALYLFGKISKAEYYGVFNEFPAHPYSFRSDYQVTEYMREHLATGERLGIVFCAGDTVIHFMLGLQDVTRLLQGWYIFSPNEFLAHHEVTTNLRNEFVHQLHASRPRYILCVHTPLEEIVAQPTVKHDPATIFLAKFMKENYTLKKTFPDNRFLFERN